MTTPRQRAINNKNRGKGFEREIVQLARLVGLKAERAWGSNGKALGHHEEVDVLIERHIKIQCKRRKRLPVWLIPNENVNVQAVRADKQGAYIVLPVWEYLNLLRIANETNKLHLPVTSPEEGEPEIYHQDAHGDLSE